MIKVKRYGYIDAIRGISIILVCLGHVFPMVCSGTEMNPVWRWFNIFEVGIFFAVSGYLTAVKDADGQMMSDTKNAGGESKKNAGRFGKYAWKKIQGLIWPYVTFSILALAALAIFFKCNGVPVKASLVPSLIEFVSLSGIGALWFLPTLCIASLIAYPGMRSRVAAALTVAVSIALTYSGSLINEFIYAICGGAPNVWVANIYTVIVRSLIASGFVVMGYYLMPMAQKFAKEKHGKNAACAEDCPDSDMFRISRGKIVIRRTAAFVICIAMTLVATPLTGLDFRKIEFSGQPILIFISVAAMLTGLVMLLKPVDERNSADENAGECRRGAGKLTVNILEFYGRNSLIVLATHLQWFIVDGAVRLMRTLTGNVSDMGIKYYAQSAAVLVIVLAAEYVICRLINCLVPWIVKPGTKQQQKERKI